MNSTMNRPVLKGLVMFCLFAGMFVSAQAQMRMWVFFEDKGADAQWYLEHPELATHVREWRQSQDNT